MTRNEIVDYEQRRWRKKLKAMQKIYQSACDVYEDDPTKANLVAMNGARKAVNETEDIYKEWVT